MKKLPSRKYLFPIPLAFILLGALFLLVRFLTGDTAEDRRFEAYTKELFTSEITSTTMNLHYTLADPAANGIEEYPISLGSAAASDSNLQAAETALAEQKEFLSSIDTSKLNDENQLIYQIIVQELKTQESAKGLDLLQEYLSPSLGVQAQLPILLCEYTFRTKQDILDYMALLKEVPEYFSQILDFEREKSKNGYFMNDAAADGVIAQCASFIENPDQICLESVFRQKLDSFQGLSEEEHSSLLQLHTKLISSCIIPAYQSLIDGLAELKGTGINDRGLAELKGGQEYYLYLLRSQVGTSDSVDTIRQRMIRQLLSDSEEMQSILSSDPSLLTSDSVSSSSQTPAEILETLQECIQTDFPALAQTDYEIKYVDESLEDYLSPAFYLTPPADTSSPNAIYINQASSMEGIELFTTLAHEGFPGHLYQTVYFARTNPQLVRYLYVPSGYVEGWATYVESYAYSYASGNPSLTRLLWLNRSINLCLYSLLDIGIHHDGWTMAETYAFLKQFGISDTATVSKIYEYIIETPANYLKYYYGYLNFLDIREAVRQKEGDHFSLKKFHEQVLELGPMPFDILRQQLGVSASQ